MSDKYTDEFNEWLNNLNKSNEEKNNYEDEELLNINNQNNDDNNSQDEKYVNNNEFRKLLFEKESKQDKEYVDKEYVDEQIKKLKPKYNYLKAAALVLVGSIIGSFAGPVASQFFNSGQKISSVSSDLNEKGQTISITNNENVSVENAVAKKAIPSVVGINVKYETQRTIFGEEVTSEGIGSGVIVSEDGYILTNAHVVGEDNQGDGEKTINVIFSDNSNSKAEIVWSDTGLDLAVIKVKKTGLKAVEFADSDNINIGDKAIAIGNPVGLNLQSTLTSGYISGLNRTITMENRLVMSGLIQTDASINSGNSGGALLNANGQLVGINTAKAGKTDGIGFAIPSNIAKSVVDKIIKDGKFEPVLLGIRGRDLANYKQYDSNNDIGVEEGVYVGQVSSNSSAKRAGLKEGDVILKIGDKKITSMNDLKKALLNYENGDKDTITIYREGKEMVLDINFSNENTNI